jgi:pimeloyl-ACP methyl ester carboxylesterase
MFPQPRFVSTNGVRLAVFEAKPEKRTRDVCVVLCHGFPELGFSWRHQLAPIAAAGFHVMAPDLRGYGQSNGPDDPQAYTMDQITADVAGLIAMPAMTGSRCGPRFRRLRLLDDAVLPA